MRRLSSSINSFNRVRKKSRFRKTITNGLKIGILSTKDQWVTTYDRRQTAEIRLVAFFRNLLNRHRVEPNDRLVSAQTKVLA